ncbi:hypothetical protein [Spiroplasma endosymbiont of Dactylopius coccus]|nr:hypothetical protein [Spiroplasma ixodetis]
MILNNNCKLFAIIVEKDKTYKLKVIEENYKKSTKSKKKKKTERRKEYGLHKSYLIAQLITIKNKNIKL